MVDASQKTPAPMSVFNDRECQFSVIAHTLLIGRAAKWLTANAAELMATLITPAAVAILDTAAELAPLVEALDTADDDATDPERAWIGELVLGRRGANTP